MTNVGESCREGKPAGVPRPNVVVAALLGTCIVLGPLALGGTEAWAQCVLQVLVATAATVVVKIIGKARREGKTCYYVNDGVYHTFSGILFDHCQYRLKALQPGKTEICAVFGQTCDALDTISLAEELPDLEIDDLLYAPNIGAYAAASATWFNGFPPAKVVHVNQAQ